MKIYHNNTEVLDVEVDDNSYRYRAVKGEHALTLYFSLEEHVEIPVGSYCVFQGETYTLEKPESLKMEHTRKFEYTVVFDSSQAKATKWKFRNPVDRRLKFPLTAKPIEHLQMFVDNMNMRDSGWTVGRCIDAPEKLVTYNHAFCFEALGMMADEFETEWEIDKKVVSLGKVEYFKDNPLPLSYGRGNGFKPGLGRTNFEGAVPVEILYVQGGNRNIDPSKYGGSELLLPKSQTIRFDGERFEDEAGFDASKARAYITDADGLSIRRADKELSSMVEDSLDCTEIYPSRVGAISSVVVVDAENNLYDIVDNSIPDGLNFEDYLIAGETMTIIPQSGMLAGREFEVKYVHKAIVDAVNNKAARRFEIVPQEIDGLTMPGGVFVPKVGDSYAVFHCMLPASYICDNATKSGASWDMFRQGVKYLYDNEAQKFSFTGNLNGKWAKDDWLNIGGRIKPGGFVLFSDARFQPEGVAIRIVGVKDFINDPHSPEIELSNSTVGRSVAGALKKLENDEILIDEARKNAVSYTKRRFRDAEEHLGLIEKAVQGYDKGINPSWVHTMAALFGDDTLQFRFVDDKTTPEAVDSGIRWSDITKTLTAPAGIIQHLTIGITSLSPTHAASEYTFWDLPGFTSPVLDTTEPMYVYAKCSKTNSKGEFYLSTTPMDFDNADGNYYLLIGTLSSEFEGARSYVESYGFTEILPGRITLWKIVDPDGFQFWDMLNKAFRIGNADTYVDYNSRGDKKLRIKGTIFQSDSGDESFPGVFRGEYGSSITYHSGDEVTYTVNGATSTYRYIGTSPGAGRIPTNTTYWQVVASAGSNGDYYEYRYAVNGSRTTPPSLTATSAAPNGWSTTMPTAGSLQYLWCTSAKKSAAGTLLQNWSTPTRITGYDGRDGVDGAPGAAGASGEPGPTVVFRGVYSGSATYYGTSRRVDCVKYNNTYYIARIDAGNGFTGVLPTSTSKWNDFGAQFDMIATNLLLAEGASIGNWFIQGGKIVSTLGTGNKITLDASMAEILIESAVSGGGYTMDSALGSIIELDANQGIVQVRAKNRPYYSTGTAYMSPTGIFANLAGTEALSATTGRTHRAAIVGLGYANVNKSEWSFGADEAIIAGVYGLASNSGTAPAFGGYFWNLKACGLVLNRRYISDSNGGSNAATVSLSASDSLVIGLVNSGITKTIYLPTSPVEGQTVFIMQMGAGTLRVDTYDGSRIYDDTSENTYYDVPEGYTAMFTFGKWAITSGSTTTSINVWCVGRFKF